MADKGFFEQYIFRYLVLKVNDKTTIESKVDEDFSKLISDFSDDEIKSYCHLGFKNKDELLSNFILKKNILEETKILIRKIKLKNLSKKRKKIRRFNRKNRKIRKKLDEQVMSEIYKRKIWC